MKRRTGTWGDLVDEVLEAGKGVLKAGLCFSILSFASVITAGVLTHAAGQGELGTIFNIASIGFALLTLFSMIWYLHSKAHMFQKYLIEDAYAKDVANGKRLSLLSCIVDNLDEKPRNTLWLLLTGQSHFIEDSPQGEDKVLDAIRKAMESKMKTTKNGEGETK